MHWPKSSHLVNLLLTLLLVLAQSPGSDSSWLSSRGLCASFSLSPIHPSFVFLSFVFLSFLSFLFLPFLPSLPLPPFSLPLSPHYVLQMRLY